MHLLNPVVSAYPIAMQKVVSRGHVHTSCPPKNSVILDVSYIPGEKWGPAYYPCDCCEFVARARIATALLLLVLLKQVVICS
jgi:hypothetical protein